MPTQVIEQLLRVTGNPPNATRAAVDWATVEDGLGISLPFDYKTFVDQAPAGTFGNELLPTYPGLLCYPANDFLAPKAHILDTFMRWRESGDGNFPFPLYPEPEGVLLWASGNSFCYWWLTGSNDPNDWPVVTSNRSFTQWQTHKHGMAQFVLDELDAGRLPHFKPYPAARPRVFEPRKANEKATEGLPLPQDHSAALIVAIGPPSTWKTHNNWPAIETRLGTALPNDYKTFIDACGTGTVCDITIFGPDMCESRDIAFRQGDQAAAADDVGLAQYMSFHPRKRGLLCWGRRADGTYLSWKTARDNPEQWTVAAFLPHMRSHQFFEDMSFSTFLLRYSGVTPPTAVIVGAPWLTSITFDHHQCLQEQPPQV